MRVAILHYHLRRGGVTLVIRRAADQLLREGHSVTIASGEPPAEGLALPSGTELAVCEQLGYCPQGERGASAEDLADRLTTLCAGANHDAPDVWCIHNHSLGRNPAYARLPSVLAQRGEAVVLHLHDFAEDGRPENYRSLGGCLDVLYPVGARVRYALLNQRDLTAMKSAGAPHEHLVVLPNPVLPPAGAPSTPPAPSSDLLLYPARGIRRKNIGEAVLLSVLLRGRLRVSLTLPPESPVERRAYDAWAKYAEDRSLPIDLAAGIAHGGELGVLLESSRAVLTTSIKEGFGLAFLEPWLAARAVVGRDIPHVTADFAKNGIELTATYQRLPVSAEFFGGLECLRSVLAETMAASWQAYGRDLPPEAVSAAMQSIVDDSGCADFGRLSPVMQRRAMDTLLAGAEPTSFRPALEAIEQIPDTSSVARNAQAIAEAYSPAAHVRALLRLCEKAVAARADALGYLDAARVLDGFLDPATATLATLIEEAS